MSEGKEKEEHRKLSGGRCFGGKSMNESRVEIKIIYLRVSGKKGKMKKKKKS